MATFFQRSSGCRPDQSGRKSGPECRRSTRKPEKVHLQEREAEGEEQAAIDAENAARFARMEEEAAREEALPDDAVVDGE